MLASHRSREQPTHGQQTITLLTDDIDGSDADSSLEFGFDGVNYTIDVSAKNAGKLRTALEPYLAAASRVGRTATAVFPPALRQANRDQNQAIREWAGNNGYEVSERGRIPNSIVEAFHSKR